MASSLVTADLAQRVRRLIDLAVDENTLPDELIQDYLWTSGAEAEVKRRDVNWATYAEAGPLELGDQIERLRVALACLVAAALCPVIPALTSLQTVNQRWSRTAFDAEKRAAQLRGMADTVLALNTEVDGSREPFRQFLTVCGRRGR